MHHAFPNRHEYDVDIENEPVIHLWFPSVDSDVWYRKYQHLYYPFAYSFLFVSWRIQSLQFVFGSGENYQRFIIALNYLWLFLMPWNVSIASVLISGFLVAIVVTSNHQPEEMIESDAPYCFVTDQFKSTRGVSCADYITGYLFGGMQY
jgi:hypothetical protein